MVNRIADRIMNAVLPHTKAAAPCGPSYYKYCYCANYRRYSRLCRDCTGAGGGCSNCYYDTGGC